MTAGIRGAGISSGTMKIQLRIALLFLLLPAAPLAVYLFLTHLAAVQYGALAAALAAALAGLAGAIYVLRGVALPLGRLAAAANSFRDAEHKLSSPLPKEGWPETAALISSLNRLMLELSAYRAFHLNQVVEERAKAQALIETIGDAILLVDDRGRLIHSNKLALKVLRIPEEEPDTVLPGSVREGTFRPALEGILGSADNYVKAEVCVPASDNGAPVARDFRVISRQFMMAAFKRPGRVIVIRDVTVEKEIESARETFFHMITHDMRAPLASIQGYAQLMSKSASISDVLGKYLRAIINSSARLNGMIEDILNMIKLEKGEMSASSEELYSTELCARVYELYEPLASRKNLAFKAPAPGLEIPFKGDGRLLERVLSNLAGNAMKFTPSGGAVSLSTRRVPGAIEFRVEDTGPGIPADKQKEIFEKYSQLEEHRYMGFGLGLAMCKMAVELHGGRIWVESQEGRGSKFIFTIPEAPDARNTDS